jgi:hypothetical protein
VAFSQLKSIILAYTELKYHQQDIYQISSAEIGRVLRELNENNNRLLDHKSTNPPAVVPPPPSATALLSTATPTVLTVSPVRYQLVSVPVTATSITTTTQQLPRNVVKLPLDHDYSVQRGALRVAGDGCSADKTTSVVVVLKEDVINVSSMLTGKGDTPVISTRHFFLLYTVHSHTLSCVTDILPVPYRTLFVS